MKEPSLLLPPVPLQTATQQLPYLITLPCLTVFSKGTVQSARPPAFSSHGNYFEMHRHCLAYLSYYAPSCNCVSST